MCLCVGASPTTPSILINSIITISSEILNGIIRAFSTDIYKTLKEKMSMYTFIFIALLGTAGVLVDKVDIATSRAPKLK